MPLKYVVITPVRNEGGRFGRTVASMESQEQRPARWVIVNDGSTDSTGQIADAAAGRHDWIRVIHRPDRGRRLPGTGVMETFYDGLEAMGDLSWDCLVKLDGDLAFAPDYFKRCLGKFAENTRLGIGGGMVCCRRGGQLVSEVSHDPPFHVRGATKMYRRACWEQIGGLICLPGWDTVDELKANMLGWQTRTFADLAVEQLKATGTADGAWQNWIKNGLANYVTGYHPLFMLAKCCRRSLRYPWLMSGLALGWGYLSGYLKRLPRVEDPAFKRYVWRQQWNHLRFRTSLWSVCPAPAGGSSADEVTTAVETSREGLRCAE